MNVCKQRAQYVIRVVARDKGRPGLSSSVLVELNVVDRANRPPVWDQPVYGPINILEDTSVGHTVYSVKARFVPCQSNEWLWGRIAGSLKRSGLALFFSARIENYQYTLCVHCTMCITVYIPRTRPLSSVNAQTVNLLLKNKAEVLLLIQGTRVS